MRICILAGYSSQLDKPDLILTQPYETGQMLARFFAATDRISQPLEAINEVYKI